MTDWSILLSFPSSKPKLDELAHLLGQGHATLLRQFRYEGTFPVMVTGYAKRFGVPKFLALARHALFLRLDFSFLLAWVPARFISSQAKSFGTTRTINRFHAMRYAVKRDEKGWMVWDTTTATCAQVGPAFMDELTEQTAHHFAEQLNAEKPTNGSAPD